MHKYISTPLPPGNFLPDEKVTKESPRGGYPLWVLPVGAIIIPPSGFAAPPQKGAPTCTAKIPRGCRKLFTPATNTARAEGRGIKGGYAPFAGGPGTRRFLAYLCLLSLREKVGRGAGRSARWWVQGLPSRKSPGVEGRSALLMGRSAEDGAKPLLASSPALR